jgi:hypothetical protein
VAYNTTASGSAYQVFAGNIFNMLQVKAANGPPIYSVSDPLAPYLIDMFSGQVGVLGAEDPKRWPTYNDVTILGTVGGYPGAGTGTTANGNFLAQFSIPFEITPGYGALAIGDASLQPQLHFNIQPYGSLLSTGPLVTTPTLTVEVDLNYLAAVDGSEPPGLGTTLQWQQVQANPTVGSGSSMKVQLGRTAGWLTTLILIFRDSAGNATDWGWPGGSSSTVSPFGNPASGGKRLRLYVDGIPIIDEDVNTRMNRMAQQFPGLPRYRLDQSLAGLPIGTQRPPATTVGGAIAGGSIGDVGVGPQGVLAYTFRNSLSQAVLGQADTGETWLPTSPGTLIELEGSPWGSFGNAPGQITALMGCIIPSGGVRRGVGDLG